MWSKFVICSHQKTAKKQYFYITGNIEDLSQPINIINQGLEQGDDDGRSTPDTKDYVRNVYDDDDDPLPMIAPKQSDDDNDDDQPAPVVSKPAPTIKPAEPKPLIAEPAPVKMINPDIPPGFEIVGATKPANVIQEISIFKEA